jgi:hypothetical protein
MAELHGGPAALTGTARALTAGGGMSRRLSPRALHAGYGRAHPAFASEVGTVRRRAADNPLY